MKNNIIDFVDMILDVACETINHAGNCFIYNRWVGFYVRNRWMNDRT